MYKQPSLKCSILFYKLSEIIVNNKSKPEEYKTNIETTTVPCTVRRRGHGQAACLPTIPHTQTLHRFCYILTPIFMLTLSVLGMMLMFFFWSIFTKGSVNIIKVCEYLKSAWCYVCWLWNILTLMTRMLRSHSGHRAGRRRGGGPRPHSENK